MKFNQEPTSQDLVDNPEFRAWVYRGDKSFDWEAWQNERLSRRQTVETARNILVSIASHVREPSPEAIDSHVRDIVSGLAHDKEREVITPAGVGEGRGSWVRWARIAAALVLLTTLGVTLHLERLTAHFNERIAGNTSGSMHKKEAWVTIKNETNQTQLVHLPDGSSVILTKASVIQFPEVFAIDKREVRLSGEAFFEIQKNPNVPFFTYAGELTARVIGTSFTAKAYQHESVIRVKTGKVAVFPTSQSGKQKGTQTEEILLLPEQQAVLAIGGSEIVKTNEPKVPTKASNSIENQSFVFDRTSVIEVFSLLEKIYHVTIQYDKEKLRGCSVTASLGDDPLGEKLDLLCEILSASYEIHGNVIRVEAVGCD